MDLNITLAPGNEGTVSCNSEAKLSPEKIAALWKTMNLILPFHETLTPPEKEFRDRWVAARGLTPEAVNALPPFPSKLNDGTLNVQFKDALRNLRMGLRELDDRATIYKTLFITAFYAQRDLTQLIGMISQARESFIAQDMAMSTLIGDGVSKVLPNFPYKLQEATPKDREAILVSCLIILNADKQKHVLELQAYRLISSMLEVGSMKNERLAELIKVGIDGLLASISPPAMPVALTHMLRMVLADQSLQAEEIKIVKSLTSRMPPSAVQTICKLVGLEQGKKVEI